MPTFNRLKLLSRALDSVFQQSVAVDEITVIDDGSDDGTSDWLTEHYPAIKLLKQTNQGVSAARNAGIRAAKYDWIALLDSDDEWLPDKIVEIKKYHQLHAKIKLIHSEEIWIRDGVRVNAMNKHRKQGGWIYQQCLPLCVISPSAVVLRRELFDEVGLFDENLPACEDYDLWLRICQSYEVGYIEQPLIKKYGGHRDQLSSKFWGMDRFRIRVLNQILDLETLNDCDRKATEVILQKKLRILINGAKKHDNQTVLDEFLPMLKQNSKVTITC